MTLKCGMRWPTRLDVFLTLMLMLPVGVPATLHAQDACEFRARAGLAVATEEAPQGDDADIGTGAVFGFGPSCGARLRIGVDAELHLSDERWIAYFLLGVGVRSSFGTDRGSPWLSLAAQAGPYLSRFRHDRVTLAGSGAGGGVDPPRRRIQIEDEGIALGGALRVGIPIGRRWNLIAEAGVRASWLQVRTGEVFPALARFTEVRIPLTIGASLQP